MKMVFYILLGVLLILLVFVGFKLIQPSKAPQNLSLSQVCYGQKCFLVELAKTKEQLAYGLMNRKELAKDSGMLFIFEKDGMHPFWMKNTLISLDIIWINNSGKVVFIKENAEPCSNIFCNQIIPQGLAKYVLELNAKTVEEIGLKVGDSLEIKY